MKLSESQALLKDMAICAIRDSEQKINTNQLAKSMRLKGDEVESWLTPGNGCTPTQTQFMAMQKAILRGPKSLFIEEQMQNLDEIDTFGDLIEQGIESDQMKAGWHISAVRSLKRIVGDCRTNLTLLDTK